MVKVKLQWGKEKFDNVELDENSDIQEFRAMLYSLTNVPPAKQKILYKGSVLKVKKILKRDLLNHKIGRNRSCQPQNP